MEPTSKYGRTSERNAEVPANPAAIMNGNSGRQQLDAATILAIAARLAATVCWLRWTTLIESCLPMSFL
jgi:hypothetical protein